ncbi:MAG: carboxypeptidase-like regulatory domain-containing protein [Terracidiphilus sp.]|jgi:hypothetical protein
MGRKLKRLALIAEMIVAGGLTVLAQSPGTLPASPAAPPTPQQEVQGGRLHGVVKSGNTPLPGVTVTAQNTLTGKRYSTTSDINGAWSLTIPQNGRYVLRTQFAAFAPDAQETVLNTASRDQAVNFELTLASRAAEGQQSATASSSGDQSAIRQLAANGAQNLNLMSAISGDTDMQNNASGASGAALPSIAGDAGFSGDSVAINGQAGAVSPLAGVDMDRLRDAIEGLRAQGGLPGSENGGNFSGMAGGFGGGLRGGSFGEGGRSNFRGFNPGQPHGAIFWIGSNSALNAEPFSLRGQSPQQPPSGTNRFGITFMSAPYLPGVTKPSGKDTIFLTLSGTRSSNPLDEYATVPTDGSYPGTYDQRTGDFTGQPAIFDPANDTKCVNFGATPGAQFPDNIIPQGCIVSQATTLLLGNQSATPPQPQYIPYQNLPGDTQNYHLLATAQSNATQAGVRYMRNLGKNATQPGGGRGGGRRSQNQGLRQSINFNYNWSDSASDNLNIFPQLGGKSSSNANSVQTGYTIGYHKITSIFNVNWNRSASQATNYFTNGSDVANEIGIEGTDSSKLNYGLPDIVFSNITGVNEQQPSFSLTQTISLSETLSWIHGKHNLRFGGDYRRVHRDFLGSSNATGTFTFSGLFTEDAAHDATTGSSLADFLLGLPQETAIDASAGKSYLRDNVWDAYVSDDWRARPNLTLNYGVRYEYFAPYTEKYNRLAFIDTNPATNSKFSAPFEVADEVPAGGAGRYNGNLPDSLVFPFRTAFAPRLGAALRLPKQTVVRAGYGVNYSVGQYASFASTMARQPLPNDVAFVNEQTNEAGSACIALTLAEGFCPVATTAAPGNYALDPHYHLPYVQAWNLDVQKSLPWGVVLNAGYNGSRGNHLDISSAPRSTPNSSDTNINFNTDQPIALFTYDQPAAFSKFNAGTLRVNKRLSSGIALGANYQYSHSIDDAGTLGGVSTVVAQNWQDLRAEEGNSSSDQRHKVSGSYLYELPFGKDKFWVTSGTGSHILEGFSVSGSFTFATGTPLTPSYQATVTDVANGTAGTQRPNRVPGVSVTAGAGSLREWFNPAAFTQPPDGSTSPNCLQCGNVSRNSVAGPGTIQNNMTLSKTMQLGSTRSMELRATANNVFNTVQYAGVDTNAASPTFGQVTSAGTMRAFQFTARYRF